MTAAAGIDLDRLCPNSCDASGVARGFLIPLDYQHRKSAGEVPNRTFEQSGFAGTRRTH
jgi:hypothetical protein